MSKVTTTIQIIEDNPKIFKMILNELARKLNIAIPKAIPGIKEDIQAKVKRLFVQTDVYNSLINGPLDAHFGLPRGSAIERLDAIIDTIAENAEVNFHRVNRRGNGLVGGISVGILIKTFEDILSLPAAHVLTEKGEDLPWLEWLLIRGDEIIIANYKIRFGNYPKRSRSGKAIMIEDDASAWKVPIGASGTINNNWLTQAVRDSRDFFSQVILRSVGRNILKVI